MKKQEIQWAYFAPDRKSPFRNVKWKSFDSLIQNTQGQVIFSQKKVKAPDFWSQMAVDIAASKYLRRPYGKFKGESSIEDLISRVTSAIRKAGLQQKVFSSTTTSKKYEQELQYILLHQMAAFNSPVWFNCGLSEAYNLKSPAENFYFDLKTKKITPGQDGFLHPQCSACFIQSVDDSLLGIFDLVKQEAKLFKYGSGSGSNFSILRGKNEKISSGGTSSGLMSFLEVFDKAAGVIKSGGTTRRAAKMVVVDVDHPEIEEFIDWKVQEEKKVQTLVAGGYSADFDGEAYHTVSGQNSNNSIRLTAEFMRAVESDAPWILRNRSDKKIYKSVSARALWQKMTTAAWQVADPGLHFSDHINAWHTCSASGPIRSSNPCSEFVFLDDTACNLASINLLKFLKEDGRFDFEAYRHTVRVLITAQEILVDYSSYPTQKIAQNSHDFRPLGLGFANLGALVMSMGLAYDSFEARTLASVLSAILTGESYLRSAELAGQLGSFKGFQKNRKPFLKVIGQHSAAVFQLAKQIRKIPAQQADVLAQYLENLWVQTQQLGEKNGFRNAQVSVIAPTGTIAFLMDCDTTGIEPDFSLIKFKKLVGGGTLKIVNHSVTRALKNLNYTKMQIEQITSSLEKGQGLPTHVLKAEHFSIFDCALAESQSKRQISLDGHLLMMAAVQPFISGAISKTVNLAADCTIQDVSEVYWKAWKLGLKAITIYRDQSKMSQPLNQKKSVDKNEKSNEVKTSTLRKWSAPALKELPLCPQCQTPTQLQSGCFLCPQCGTSIGCS